MRLPAALFALVAFAAPGAAQDTIRQLTADDYARSERLLSEHTEALVYGASVTPHWLVDGRFWYENRIREGIEFILVDPRARTREQAFDHGRLAAALAAAGGGTFTAQALPIQSMTFEGETLIVELAELGRYACAMSSYRCEQAESFEEPSASRLLVVSPDGSLVVFIRDYDLWVRNVETDEETRLTTDGREDFGYATDNAGWTKSDEAVVKWSPDSRKIATFQHDARGVGMMYLVNTQVGHPELQAWKYPLPEDSVIFRISRIVIDLDRPTGDRVVRFDMPPDQHRSTCSDHIRCGRSFGDVEWAADSETLAFVSTSRDHKSAKVRLADVSTGQVTDLFEEVEQTFFESNGWRYLSESNEILWFSQREDWGHLYLYDSRTGVLESQVTTGDWNVLDIIEVDESSRTVTVLGNEREAGDPYFQYFYEIDLDDGDVTLLTPDSANHTASFSPDGEYLVDTYSTPVVPSVTVLRDRRGRPLMTLEEADISDLVDSGWQPPMPFSVKARDGATDLYGLLFRPMDFDENAKYPVVNYLYPGPQSGSVGSRSFRASHRDLQSIAELGFVVIELDAMGTPGRS